MSYIFQRKKELVLLVTSFLLAGGCTPIAPDQSAEIGVTQQLRDVCPTLSDEVIEGFIIAISGLRDRDDGLNEADAAQQLVDGCENIPPDGNFQGDIESCRSCLPVIVDHVYD